MLSGLLRQAGMNELARFQRVAAAWRDCLPEHAKVGCRLTKIEDGVLHAAVDTAALNFELSGFLKPDLLQKIRQRNVGYIRDIRFKVVSRSTSESGGRSEADGASRAGGGSLSGGSLNHADASVRARPGRRTGYNSAH